MLRQGISFTTDRIILKKFLKHRNNTFGEYYLLQRDPDFSTVDGLPCFTGEAPYPDCDSGELKGLLSTGYRMPRPTHCPDMMYVSLCDVMLPNISYDMGLMLTISQTFLPLCVV